MDCGTPEDLEHGHFTLASNVTYYGAAVLYECNSNYELDGHARRLCLDNGTWSSGTPSCKGACVAFAIMMSDSQRITIRDLFFRRGALQGAGSK